MIKEIKKQNAGLWNQRLKKKIDVDLNWLGMQIEQTKERIAFALSFLSPEDARKEYFPSEFHRYPGIREELEGLNFED